MPHHLGQVPVRWQLADIQGLDYFYEPFNDQAILDHWQAMWGWQFRTGLQADYRSVQPDWCEQTVKDLADQGWDMAHVGSSFYVMRPGDLLPRHQDTYTRYCRHHGCSPNQVWRAIVFLQAWQPGHLFEIDDRAVTGYAAGTYVIWHYDAPHMAGNVGCVPRYTLQITGTKKS